MRRIVLSLAVSLCAFPVFAAMQAKPIEWKIGDESFSGVLVYDDADDDKRPGLVMVPNWMGVSDLAVQRAREIAEDDYVVLVADVYGANVRPKDAKEAGAAARGAYADGGTTLRARARKAVDVLKAQAGNVPLDASKIGALGFCFGGSTVLELARSGSEVAGVVSFHGGLDTHLPTEGNDINTSILVLNGADDSSVPDKDIAAFEKEMDAAKADWQFVNFSGAVHCFTQPESNNPPNCVYNERASERAFEMMDDFFAERFAAD